jgi:amino-acid N-acetyltransferase
MKTIDVASSSVKGKTRRLLEECGLPFDDVDMSLLQHFLVVRKDDQDVVGVVGLEVMGQVALLRSLAVHESHRKQGLASQLITKIEAYARSMGIRELYLLALSNEEFFHKRYYQNINRNDVPAAVKATRQFQSLCPETAVCMVKYL